MDEALRDPKEPPRLPRTWQSWAVLDPSVRAVVDATNFDGAYGAAYRCTDVLDRRFFHHSTYGEVWVRWIWAIDLWESDGVPEQATHAVLRHLATTWLDRPGDPTEESVRRWLADSESTIKTTYEESSTRASAQRSPGAGSDS